MIDERVSDVRCADDTLIVDMMDGRTISVPLAWYLPCHWRGIRAWRAERLSNAPSGETCGGGYGIHWPELNEDLSTEGLLRWAAHRRRPEVVMLSPASTRIPMSKSGLLVMFY